MRLGYGWIHWKISLSTLANWNVSKVTCSPSHKNVFLAALEKWLFLCGNIPLGRKCIFYCDRNWKYTRNFIFQLKNKYLYTNSLIWISYILSTLTEILKLFTNTIDLFESCISSDGICCFTIQLVGKVR